ncbi:MAG: hypothetical protein FWD79_11710 [Desulfobulbus sp.]|nr:hypothetical protein [Desulfobulbus sp.]
MPQDSLENIRQGQAWWPRVIYFLRTKAGQIVLMAAYSKNERTDVPRQWLRKIREHFNEQDK